MSQTRQRLGLDLFVEELPDQETYLRKHPYPVLLIQPRGDSSIAPIDSNAETHHGESWAEVVEQEAAAAHPEAQIAWLTRSKPEEGGVKIVTFGRSRRNDVVFRHGEISKKHAAFRPLVQDMWVIEDLDSTNGTFIEGVRVNPGRTVSLNDGAKLRFGNTLLATFFEPASFWAYCAHLKQSKGEAG